MKYYDRQVIDALFYVSNDTIKRIGTLINLETSAARIEFTRDNRDFRVYADVRAESHFDAIQVWDMLFDYLEQSGILFLHKHGILEDDAKAENTVG